MLEEFLSQNIFLVSIVLFFSYVASTLLVGFFGKECKSFSLFLKEAFFSKESAFVLLGVIGSFGISVYLYDYGDYAWFVFGVLVLFLTLGVIDCLRLAVPDLLNFALLFYIFAGLYYFGLLGSESFISSFALLGAFALLRMLGGFVFGKEVMGEADLIVMGSIGAFFPLFYGCYIVVASAILAMMYILILGAFYFRNKTISLQQIKIPFVFFLFLGFVLGLVYERYPLFGVLNV